MTDWAADPPAPVQVNVNIAVVSTTMEVLPLVASGPVQAELPLAVQLVAFCELHVNCTA